VGGAGVAWPFSSPACTYGAGGGGASMFPSNIAPPANPGGGTIYGRGGAGGGPVNASTAGNAGLGGAVFLAIPTPQYPGSAPGGTVIPPFPGAHTVIRYTSPATYTV
jgi:hypothetical protein